MTDAGVEPSLGETVVSIDDCDLTRRESVKMIGTLGRSGMRIEVVLDEEFRVRPEFEGREPDQDEEGSPFGPGRPVAGVVRADASVSRDQEACEGPKG